jgi:hypothetical protein
MRSERCGFVVETRLPCLPLLRGGQTPPLGSGLNALRIVWWTLERTDARKSPVDNRPARRPREPRLRVRPSRDAVSARRSIPVPGVRLGGAPDQHSLGSFAAQCAEHIGTQRPDRSRTLHSRGWDFSSSSIAKVTGYRSRGRREDMSPRNDPYSWSKRYGEEAQGEEQSRHLVGQAMTNHSLHPNRSGANLGHSFRDTRLCAGKAFASAVVATDTASAHADYDNGTALQRQGCAGPGKPQLEVLPCTWVNKRYDHDSSMILRRPLTWLYQANRGQEWAMNECNSNQHLCRNLPLAKRLMSYGVLEGRATIVPMRYATKRVRLNASENR